MRSNMKSLSPCFVADWLKRQPFQKYFSMKLCLHRIPVTPSFELQVMRARTITLSCRMIPLSSEMPQIFPRHPINQCLSTKGSKNSSSSDCRRLVMMLIQSSRSLEYFNPSKPVLMICSTQATMSQEGPCHLDSNENVKISSKRHKISMQVSLNFCLQEVSDIVGSVESFHNILINPIGGPYYLLYEVNLLYLILEFILEMCLPVEGGYHSFDLVNPIREPTFRSELLIHGTEHLAYRGHLRRYFFYIN